MGLTVSCARCHDTSTIQSHRITIPFTVSCQFPEPREKPLWGRGVANEYPDYLAERENVRSN